MSSDAPVQIGSDRQALSEHRLRWTICQARVRNYGRGRLHLSLSVAPN